MTGIPRSTVGYYFRKFNKKGERDFDSQRFEKEVKETEKEKSNRLDMVNLKLMFQRQISEIMKIDNYQEQYYALGTFKLLMELSKYYNLTPEESRVFFDSFKPNPNSVNPTIGIVESPTEESYDLDEILKKAMKKPKQ